MADRVVVFLDYQNVYSGAREAFHRADDPGWCGQVDPERLGQFLARDSPFDRRLAQVRVYRGAPVSDRDTRGFIASRRQHGRWLRSPLVYLTARPLRYPRGWPDACQPGEAPQEKGVDVALAVDFVTMAVQRQFDVGIVMSGDSDLLPALEFVVGLMPKGGPRAEIAAWRGSRRSIAVLAVPGRRLWCHRLDARAYASVADLTDYRKRVRYQSD